MPLYIRDNEVDALASELQRVTKAPTKTDAVKTALKHELERKRAEVPLIDRIRAIQAEARQKLGPVDPDFDMKKFSDELYEDM